jgi:hypothetical protein
MAEKLIRYYKFIADAKGLGGKVELAQMTKLPSVKAALEPDTADHLRAFREAIRKMTGQEPPSF